MARESAEEAARQHEKATAAANTSATHARAEVESLRREIAALEGRIAELRLSGSRGPQPVMVTAKEKPRVSRSRRRTPRAATSRGSISGSERESDRQEEAQAKDP